MRVGRRKAKGADVNCNRTTIDPDPKHGIHALYYCQAAGCHVRYVSITGKWEDGDRPARPRFTCPGCGEKLELESFLKETGQVQSQ